MKIWIIAPVLALTLSGCWDEPKEKQSSEFMSNLATCSDCRLKKPLLGPGSEADGN